MNADRLLALYEKVSESPDAVPRLRRFVLDLAVRGKLVAQDAGDEPASELLKRIAADKARLVKAGDIKRADANETEVEEPPFASPHGWEWSTVATLVHVEMGQSPPSEHYNQQGEGTPFFQGKTDFGPRHPTPRYWCTRPTKIAKPGDILISVRAPVGPTNVATETCCIGRGLAALRPYTGLDREFLLRTLNSFATELEAMGFGTTFVAINKKQLTQFPLPLPPLAEQRRIVAKVEELMALLDRLAAARTAREATRDRLTAASLARLTAPETELEDFPTHARFALATLPALTTRPDQIRPLRQTILNLAVRGKLVEQNPTDEPASELFARIQEWHRNSIAQKKIRKPRKPLASVANKEHPYACPRGWAFVRLGEIIYIQSGDGLTAANMNDGPIPVFGGNGVTGHHDRCNVEKPTIVIGRVGYYCGSIHVTPPNAWVTDNAFITHFAESDIDLHYLVRLLNGTNLKEEENATAQPVISGSKIYPIIVGLPPLAEQHRIVAKVDALMALCDRLEAALTTTDTTRARLLEALLHEALEPSPAALEAAE